VVLCESEAAGARRDIHHRVYKDSVYRETTPYSAKGAASLGGAAFIGRKLRIARKRGSELRRRC